MSRKFAAALAAITLSLPAWAHHGFGRFDPSGEAHFEGTLTGLDFVNPHSYVYLDVTEDDGSIMHVRCEMRAATVLRRSGWSPEMFVPGVQVVVDGRPHRDDPASCYVETLALGEEVFERYEQLTDSAPPALENRPLRLASGELNISGDWAQEQYLMARGPGGRGGLVPKSMVAGIESGELSMEDVPNSGWGARPLELTEAGQAASDAVREIPPEENLRARCEITSVLFDWVFDGPLNRITQRGDTIRIQYGRGLDRTIYMGMTSHPANVTPSRGGHSIGQWEGDTLVVDTIGFEPGVLAGFIAHSDQLHVVERFTLDPETLALTRDYVADDPAYFAEQYASSDIVKPADVPFAYDECRELTYINFAEEGQEQDE